MTDQLTLDEKQTLLRLARQALELGVRSEKLPPLDWDSLSPLLRADGASFVTLTVGGELRGCIGALEAYQPLVEDVREHTIAAALEDYRFPPVQTAEIKEIQIEVSRLTAPVPLEYARPADLVAKFRPRVDGVILRDGNRRADDFLDNLCHKMGAAPDLWRRKHLDVSTYQVEEFHE
jgi:AmmeMemoRadiSam system protein A